MEGAHQRAVVRPSRAVLVIMQAQVDVLGARNADSCLPAAYRQDRYEGLLKDVSLEQTANVTLCYVSAKEKNEKTAMPW